ncbi:lipase maturation factor family protein [PVC group bacterium]|nr:lipase maturation factor family protein [PVC group bacterium]
MPQVDPKIRKPQVTYFLTRNVFLRSLGFIYLIAFAGLAHQMVTLVGHDGILPAEIFLKKVELAYGEGWGAFSRLPTIFWFFLSDHILEVLSTIGIGLSILLVMGFANPILLLALWGLYISFVHIGQIFYGYGWEMMLLEAGFLAVFLCPITSWKISKIKTHPPAVIFWLYRWMLFRVMFGAGLIKLRGHECWRDLTCLYYHFETQPIPNPLSRFLHFMPSWFLKSGVVMNHFVEIVAPWFLFWPRRLRIVFGLIQIGFQITLIVSGNLSWLNWLTLVLCIPCLDDQFLLKFSPRHVKKRFIKIIQNGSRTHISHRVMVWMFTVLTLILSIGPIMNMISPTQAMNMSFNNLYLVNTYGAFGYIGQERFEVILEGTTDELITSQTKWIPYEFPCKPGSVDRRPCVVSPYHYRLDWQIWFAAMSKFEYQPWLMHLTIKLLEGDSRVLRLLGDDPFSGAAPKYIRADLYRYQFTKPGTDTTDWWKRSRIRTYFPPLSLDHPVVQTFIKTQRQRP